MAGADGIPLIGPDNLQRRVEVALDAAREARRAANDAMANAYASFEGTLEGVVAELLETRSLLGNMLASSTEYSIIGKDLERRIVLWNEGARRNYGYTEAEVLGRPSDVLHDPDELASGSVHRLHAEALANGMAEGRFLRRRKDGTRFPAQVVLTRREDSRGRAVGYLLISRDITRDLEAQREREVAQRRLAEVELQREQERFKTRFLNLAAHELRTPLTSLSLQVELLRRRDMPPDVQRGIAIIHRSQVRLQGLVRDLIDATLIQAGRLEVPIEPVGLDDAVGAAVAGLQAQAAAQGVRLTARLGSGATVMANAERIGHVAQALVDNAIKFTPAGGEVTVETWAEAASASLRVRDTGRGIGPTALARLFRPFEQAHEPADVAAEGSGLGLFIARSLAEMMGGTLEAASGGPGAGAAFTLRLALAGTQGPAR